MLSGKRMQKNPREYKYLLCQDLFIRIFGIIGVFANRPLISSQKRREINRPREMDRTTTVDSRRPKAEKKKKNPARLVFCQEPLAPET